MDEPNATMKPQAFALTLENHAQPLAVAGERITILASKEATQGYEIFLQDGVEGVGPPPHSHDWDESFYVIQGNVEIGYGDKVVTGKPGSFVHLPGGTVHWFRFGAGGGQLISMTSRGGNASGLFTDIDKEIAPGPPDIPKLIAVAGRNGVVFAPPSK